MKLVCVWVYVVWLYTPAATTGTCLKYYRV
jgi:hypothetical protein